MKKKKSSICKFCKKKIDTQIIEIELKDIKDEQIHFIYFTCPHCQRKNLISVKDRKYREIERQSWYSHGTKNLKEYGKEILKKYKGYF